MVDRPCRRFRARMDPPNRVKARIATTSAKHAVLTGFALRFARESAPVSKFWFFIIEFLLLLIYPMYII
jgi:hypothetical protein